MNVVTIASGILVATGTALALAAGLGVELASGALARLHFVGILAVAAVPVFLLGAMIDASDPQSVVKLVFMGFLVLAASPVIAHVTARAIHESEAGERRTDRRSPAFHENEARERPRAPDDEGRS